MTTQQVADRFVELAQQGKYREILHELHADDAISVEMDGKTAKGRDALLAKADERESMMEKFISGRCSDHALVADNFFSITMWFEAVMKGQTEAEKMNELCVYEVKDGKIIKEQFFYDTSDM